MRIEDKDSSGILQAFGARWILLRHQPHGLSKYWASPSSLRQPLLDYSDHNLQHVGEPVGAYTDRCETPWSYLLQCSAKGSYSQSHF
ncbi:mCG147886 [Mus musculus]|nr:mCG147886 [Mus musculus]